MVNDGAAFVEFTLEIVVMIFLAVVVSLVTEALVTGALIVLGLVLDECLSGVYVNDGS